MPTIREPGSSTKRSGIDGKWYQSIWLPFAAGTYIAICIFDFMIMPIYTAAHNSRIENKVFQQLEGQSVAEFANGLVKANQATRQWNPLTLLGAGMFHLAFGALLTGGAVTRGMAKRTEIDGYYRSGSASYDSEYGQQYGQFNQPYGQQYGQPYGQPYGQQYGQPYQPQYAQPVQDIRQPQNPNQEGPMPKTTGLDPDG